MNNGATSENQQQPTRPPRPIPLTVRAENIPAELKQLNQWVEWLYEFDSKQRWTKVPYQINGRKASSTDPATWTSFDNALKRYQSGGIDGIGFVVTKEAEIVGIDLDHCYDLEARKSEQWAVDIIQSMQSYSEFSPSGQGVRIFVKGNFPNGEDGRKNGNIEVYSSGRYLTVTGHVLESEPRTVEARQQVLDELYNQVFKHTKSSRPKVATNGNGAWHPTDEELLAKAFDARNGEKIRRLFEGDISDYPSQSEADISLCSMLAFYAAAKAQLDRFFRRSGLMRDKWDERHGEKTYGERTIEKAFASRTDHYHSGNHNGAAYSGAGTGGEVEWPEPQEIPSELPTVPSLQAEMIPDQFRIWLCDIADRMQCPLEFPTIGAIVAAASLIGRQLAIRPKRQDDWEVVPNLWGGIVGRPGLLKTPALADATKALLRLEHAVLKKHEDQKHEHEIKTLIQKAQKQELEKKIKEALSGGKDPAKFAHDTLPKDEPLILRRYVVNDSTVEKLGELLNQNPNGLLLFRDELTGWLRTLDREGHENDRAFYLEAWNGNGSYTYDRIGRGTLNIKAACVSVLGGIQPGPLNDYLQLTLTGGAGADGLFQRFQLLVYPDDPGAWKNVDRWPNTEARNAAFEVFEKLDGDSFVSFGTTIPLESSEKTHADTVSFLRFSPEAQETFDDWRQDLDTKIRAGDEHPAVEAHLSKYRSLMPSLALVFHVIATVGTGRAAPVSENAAKMAAAWCDYLEAHARRVYHGLIHQDLTTASRLSKKITKGQLTSLFTARDVYRKHWTGLSDHEVIEKAAAILDDLGWLRTQQRPASTVGGRPTFEYKVNPKLVAQKD
jgi:Protein of unknown function (DUF3987)